MYICFVVLLNPEKQTVKLNIYIKNKLVNVNITKSFFTITFVLLLSMLVKDFFVLRINKYIERSKDQTTIYEDNYVNPSDVNIIADGDEKNIIYIYLESMECSFMSKQDGGYMNEELIPNLFTLAKENLNISDNNNVGGFSSPNGTDSTISAIMSSETGIPFNYSVKTNGMSKTNEFSPSIIALGDILDKNNYVQEFVCGSDVTFGARNMFFKTHKDFKLYDYYSALEDGYVDDYVNWGLCDKDLYRIAKDELLKLANNDKKFNFTMLTIDTHFGGYECELCKNEFDTTLKNTIACADRQVVDFINWIKEQDFYEDTLIVVSGDHITMDASLVSNIDTKDRHVYNCFINSGLEESPYTKNRKFSTIDMFPTILTAMGFEIEGNKLGLGVNIFSGEKTLIEELGFEYLSDEFQKFSKFYAENFYR